MDQDLPVVAVCVVSNPNKVPPNYTLIDRTHDKSEDADMWKDGYFGRRVMRYLCVQRQLPSKTDDVLVDVTLINERDDPPPGFTVLESTHNNHGEKATKKRLICLRWMVPTMTTDAITDLIFVNCAERRAPVGYTMVGNINNLALCYKMGRIPATASSDESNVGDGNPNLAYSMAPPASGLPYAPKVAATTSSPLALGINTAAASQGQHPPGPMSPPVNNNPLSGVQWKMSSQYSLVMELQKLTIPEIHGKTMSDLERQYSYTFDLEKSVSKAAVVS